MGNLKHRDITEKIIKGFYEVYNELGYGFLENVYERALQFALETHGLLVERQKDIAVNFRGHVVGEYRADMIINGKVIVEIKAAQGLASEHEAQILNYLKATGIGTGLLINFGKKPEFKRFVFDEKRISVNLCESVAEKV